MSEQRAIDAVFWAGLPDAAKASILRAALIVARTDMRALSETLAASGAALDNAIVALDRVLTRSGGQGEAK